MRTSRENARGRRWRHVLTGCAVAVVLILPGCATEIPSGSGDASGEQVHPAGLAVGDCIQDPASADNQRVDEITRVECSLPHNGEVFLVEELPDGAFPGQDAVNRAAEARCYAAADSYLGYGAYPGLQIAWYFPASAQRWDETRTITCFIHSPGSPVTGSLKGRALQLKVGDCVDSVQAPWPTEVPCATPHHSEVFLVEELPDGAFPGQDAANRAAEARCYAAADSYLAYGAYPDLQIAWYFPAVAQQWDETRAITCFIHSPDSPVTGSLKG